GEIEGMDDVGVRLADARRLDDEEIETGRFIEPDDILQYRGGGAVLATRRERAHEDRIRGQAVHANAVAEQRAARAATRRVHRDDGDLLAREVPHEAAEQLIVEARLASAARAGDAENRRTAARTRNRATNLLDGGFGAHRALQHGNRARELPMILRIDRAELVHRTRHCANARDDIRDHADEPHAPPVFGRVDLLDAVLLERF